jgi:hypothetical protein
MGTEDPGDRERKIPVSRLLVTLSLKGMMPQSSEKRFSPRVTNLLLGASIVILIAALLIRYLTPAPQEGVLALMGLGVFLFLLVAFDQPN